MFAPAHKVEGYLVAPLVPAATTMTVDTGSAIALANVLTGAFETYLIIDAGGTAKEVVRATAVTGAVVMIDRGLDGTIPIGFAATTKFRYVMAAIAIAELMSPPVELSSPDNSIYITYLEDNKFELRARQNNFYSPNYTIDFERSGDGYVGISVDASSLGCCPGDADPYY